MTLGGGETCKWTRDQQTMSHQSISWKSALFLWCGEVGLEHDRGIDLQKHNHQGADALV